MNHAFTRLARVPATTVCALVVLYRLLIAPALGPRCRHLPSCSEYALQALERHGFAAGLWLTLQRLCRCHPWGTSGYDPVPGAPDPGTP